MHYLGFIGVPRRYFEINDTTFVPASVHDLNMFISVVALIVGFAQMVFLFNLISSIWNGRPAGQSLARDDARMADAGSAAGARQLGQGPAGGLSLGLRLQRSRRGQDYLPQNMPPDKVPQAAPHRLQRA